MPFQLLARRLAGREGLTYRDSDGRLRFQVVEGDLEEAKATRADLVVRKHKGERVAPKRMTFGEWAEEWFAELDKQPRTIASYRYHLDKHLLPVFKNRQLGNIAVDDVAKLVAEMKKGYAAWTIRGTLSALSGCLAKAKRRRKIPTNPVLELERDEKPKNDREEQRVLSQAEVATLLRVGESFRPMIAVMIFAGLRMGEVLGLRWQDVDFDKGYILVRNQLSPQRELAQLKTRAARRDVVLGAPLAKVLRAHKMASRFKAEADFVFHAPDGRGRDQRSTSRGIERALTRAKLDGAGLSAHAFRHTFASLLIVGMKRDVVHVAGQLGHSNPSTTLRIYAHIFDKAQHAEDTRAAMDDYFAKLLPASS